VRRVRRRSGQATPDQGPNKDSLRTARAVLLRAADNLLVWIQGFDNHGGDVLNPREFPRCPVVIIVIQCDNIGFPPRIPQFGPFNSASALHRVFGLEENDVFGVVAGQGGYNRPFIGQFPVFEEVSFDGRCDLVDIIAGLGFLARLHGALDSGEAQSGENGNDGDDDKQLDERECRAFAQRGATRMGPAAGRPE
jgi:hypothetical protein